MRLSKPGTLLVLILATGCGGSDSTGPSNTTSGTVTATIGGATFSGSLVVQGTYSSSVLGIGATQTTGSGVKQVNITLTGVGGTGTYTLGGIAANLAVYTETVGTTAQVWTTALPGGTGSVTLTELSATKAVGTFTFTAQATTSTGAAGSKSATNGSFNVTLH